MNYKADIYLTFAFTLGEFVLPNCLTPRKVDVNSTDIETYQEDLDY